MGKWNHTFAVLAYKESPYLEECLLSLKNQTVKSHIFIATSTPSPFLDKISEKYGVSLLINSKSGGIGSDWSFAYNNCNTEYSTLAHQDDIYLPGYTEHSLLAAKKHPENLIIFTGYYELVNGSQRSFSLNLMVKKIILTTFYLFKNNIDGLSRERFLSFGNPVSCPSVMFHRGKIGVFEFSRDLLYNLDWDAWLRLSKRDGDFVYIRKRLMAHRIHEGSELMKGTGDKSRIAEDRLLFEKLWPSALAKIISKIYISLSYNSQLRGKV